MTHFSSMVRDSLITQYKESPLLISFIEHLATEADALHDEIENVQQNRYVERATGVQLDILGDILGQDREVVDTVLLGLFGFIPDTGSLGFGDADDPSAGGRFRSFYEGSATKKKLLDPEYRSFLQTKIFKNTTNCSPDQLIYIMLRTFGEDANIEFQDGNIYYTFYIGIILTDEQRYLILALDLIARTVGVRAYYIEYTPGDYFGFLEDDGALGFADGPPELIVNGEFNVDSDWDKGAGWSIGSGVASKVAGVDSYLQQVDPAVIIAGETYVMIADVTVDAGCISILVGGVAAIVCGALQKTHFAIDITAANTDQCKIHGSSTFIGEVDNVSLRLKDVDDSEAGTLSNMVTTIGGVI